MDESGGVVAVEPAAMTVVPVGQDDASLGQRLATGGLLPACKSEQIKSDPGEVPVIDIRAAGETGDQSSAPPMVGLERGYDGQRDHSENNDSSHGSNYPLA